MTSSSPQRVPIGQLLMARKAISQLELNAGLAHQNRWGGKLGTILNKLGFIKESTLNQVLSEIFQMPVVSLAQTEVEMDALELVPAAFARDHSVLPLKLERAPRKVLHLAVSRPEDTASVDELKFLSGIPQVRTYLAGETELQGAISKCYSAAPVPGKKIRLGGVELDTAHHPSKEMVIERFSKEELIRAIDTRDQGVAGTLEEMGILDILQILGAGGKTVAIHLSGPLGNARIFLTDGHIVHAETDHVQGPQAAYELVNWIAGTFTLKPHPPEVQRTIFESNDALILEGLRRADEREADDGGISRLHFYEPPTTNVVVPPAPNPAPEVAHGPSHPPAAGATAAVPPPASAPADPEMLSVDKQIRLLLRILVRKGLLTETEARAILYGKV
ncbi:MAG: DUF4388 domain-containing protein [Deltaproteobacteria bacterium]|nr:DUF4388 domain-containing protein [Deltaproteobacteria bacterium]